MEFNTISKGSLKPIHRSIVQFSTGGKKKAPEQEMWFGSAREYHIEKGKGERKAGEVLQGVAVLQDVAMLQCPSTVCWLVFLCGHSGSSFRAELTG